MHPEHDQDWFDNETKNMSKREIAQEYLCDFLSSGETVIDSDDLQHIRSGIAEPKHKSWVDRNYHIWKPYNYQTKYIISADVARGDGADYSVFHVFSATNMEQVAEYQGKSEPDQFVKLLFDTGKEYGNALLVVESNNIGFTVAQKLAEMGYRNLYYSTKGSHEYVDSNMAAGNSNVIAGFTTSLKTRPLIIAKLDEYVRNKMITFNSIRTLKELEKFIWVHGRPEAQKGYNDDLVLAAAIACFVRDTTLINSQKDVQLNLAMLNCIGKTNTRLNTTINGMSNNRELQEYNNKKTYSDLIWLLKG